MEDYRMVDNLNDLDNNTLYQYYANACATYYGAIGNSKTDYNEAYALDYADELKSRGENVPAMIVASKFGSFNGDGSY